MSAARANKDPIERIEVDQGGFRLYQDEDLQWDVAWADLRGVAAYKRDLFVVDEICLALHVAGRTEFEYVGEEMEGYEALVREMEERCPDRNAEWWGHVVVPAFEACWTVVWGDMPEVPWCQNCGHDLRQLRDLCCPTCGHVNDPKACDACKGSGRCDGRVGGWIVEGVVYFCAFLFVFYSAMSGMTRLALITAAIFVVGVWILLINFDFRIGNTCRSCSGTGQRVALSDAEPPGPSA